MSRTYSFIAAAAATTLAGSLASTANASLTVDFRFADGTHAKQITAGDLTPITFQAWAVVKGAAGNAAADGLQSLIFGEVSQVVSAGFAGAVTGTIAPGWAGSGTQPGTSFNTTADGIGDWGNTNNTPLTLSASFFRPRTTKSTNNAVDWADADSPAGSLNHTIADGVEFLVGNFTFTPSAAPAGASVNLAPATVNGGTVVPAGWYEDTADKTAGSPTGSKSQTSGSFGPAQPNAAGTNAVNISVANVPEPTSIGLLGLGALSLIRRRRA